MTVINCDLYYYGPENNLSRRKNPIDFDTAVLETIPDREKQNIDISIFVCLYTI